MMDKTGNDDGPCKLYINIIDIDSSEINKNICALENELINLGNGIEVHRGKLESDTQDTGSLLEIILYAPSIVILATGISSFIRRSRSCNLEIKHGQRTIKIKGAKPEDSVSLTRLLKELIDDSSK